MLEGASVDLSRSIRWTLDDRKREQEDCHEETEAESGPRIECEKRDATTHQAPACSTINDRGIGREQCRHDVGVEGQVKICN